MSNPISSLIFTYRSAKKAENGEIGRAPVCVGQAANVFNEVSKFDNMIGSSTKAAASIFKNLSENKALKDTGKPYEYTQKALHYTGRAVKFASENVNPLICISSGIKVATSDDKVGTGITEGGALCGMFMGEGLMKKYQDSIFTGKNVEKVIEKASKNGILKSVGEKIIKSNSSNKVALLAKGIAFVCASMSSYAIGEAAGKNFSGEIKSAFGIKKINQKA
ncbi:MAG: hypothetical protein LKG27_06980 [Clostridiaceae bacterium]|jgi:hypothetical protein|nr:hypothetical protein [Clostridiaceae bacterium]